MLYDIFTDEKIEYFAAVPAEGLRVGNRRLHDALPDSANVIFALFPYFCGVGDTLPLARFAAVPDYHLFAEKLFSRLTDYLSKKYPGCFFRGFSDHSPFAEICGAASANLGIIGENSLLINEKYSSFVCIGEMVTTLPRDSIEKEGVPFGDGVVRSCECCGRCRKACPGGCCGTAERDGCVSALNQKKGVLSPEEADAVRKSGFVWGCDVCQTVCPHTKKALESGALETPIPFFREGYLGDNPIPQILAMDDETYAAYPFSWRRREIMKRNIDIFTDKGDRRDG